MKLSSKPDYQKKTTIKFGKNKIPSQLIIKNTLSLIEICQILLQNGFQVKKQLVFIYLFKYQLSNLEKLPINQNQLSHLVKSSFQIVEI